MDLPTGFTAPDKTTLRNQIKSDMNSKLTGQDARIKRSILYVLAHVLAGVFWTAFQYIRAAAAQLLPDTCTGATLVRWGAIYGKPQGEEVKATGSITVTGTPASVQPINSIWQRDDGWQYKQTAAATIPGGGSIDVAAESVLVGADGNEVAGVALTCVSPAPGIDAAGVVAAGGMIDGADLEAEDSYRDRILERIQDPPQGGSDADYEQWVKEALPGVADRVYVLQAWAGAGTVKVIFTVLSGGTGPGFPIPAAGQITTADNYIRGTTSPYIRMKKPAAAILTTAAPVAATCTYAITCTGVDVADQPDAEDAIETALDDLLRREGGSASTVYNEEHRAAIQNAVADYGINAHGEPTDINGGGPNADLVVASGSVAVRGATVFTWV